MTASGQQATGQDQYPQQWYSRREGVIRGPFTAEEVTRYLLLGRICLDDELSTDKSTWSPANAFSDMLPPEVSNLTSWDDYRKLAEARMQADERKSGRRCRQCPNRDKCHPERRHNSDRRHEDASVPVRKYVNDNSYRLSTRWSWLLTLLLATLMIAWLYPGQR